MVCGLDVWSIQNGAFFVAQIWEFEDGGNRLSGVAAQDGQNSRNFLRGALCNIRTDFYPSVPNVALKSASIEY